MTPDLPARATLLLAALLLELVTARWIIGRAGPTAHAMATIGRVEQRLNRPHRPPRDRQIRGTVVFLAAVLAAAAVGHWLALLLGRGGAVMRLFHILLIALLLDAGGPPAEARIEAQHMAPDEYGRARGAIERLVLRFADGVVGPVIAYLLLGLGGLAAWRAIVLLQRALAGCTPFDWATVAVHRWLRLPTGLVAAAIFVMTALLIPGASPAQAQRALVHARPALAPRAALAGAFGWSLGDEHGGWIGPAGGRARLGPDDVRRAAGASTIAAVVTAAGLLLLLFVVG